ncbi:MAG: hypothetical protein U1D25_03575 [Hydrogenophaga sp.]|uniref:hypothetical protein n=1 Tax=Hydrogenophaga sp. TaxID=1904254 RepID=UPI002766E8F9|nr:hypothetical protein [Hydrogenophaga sp.]MDP2418003.1 hypothetical protein [Hydrogenophaga sp.]MDZ4187180.1 hypothetical protein [Hydrogenophaga sp.]
MTGRRCRQTRQTRWLGTVLVFLSAMWLAACNPTPPAPPWHIAVHPWVGYEPLVLAQEMGTLPPAMRVVELASSNETLRAFRNGLIEVAALTLDEALRLADEGEALHIVAALSDSAGADAVLSRVDVMVARPGIDGQRLAALLLAWDSAHQQLTHVSASQTWLAAGVDLTPAQYQQSLEVLRFLTLPEMHHRLQPTPSTAGPAEAPLAQSGRAMGGVLQSLGLIRQPPDWPSLLNPIPLAMALALQPPSAAALSENPPPARKQP